MNLWHPSVKKSLVRKAELVNFYYETFTIDEKINAKAKLIPGSK